MTAAACGAPSQTAEPASGPTAPAVQTRRTRQLRMVTTWPANFPGLGDAATRTAEMIEALSEGRMSVRLFAAGELVGAFEALDAVADGAADMYHAAEYYWQGRSPAFNFFTAVPMGLTATETMAWINHGGGQELWEELSGQHGVIAFPAGNSGHQMGGWFTREINSLEDFRGLTVRMPGLGAEVLRGMGAAAVALPGSEIYLSLQSGAIDATEWVGPWNDLAFGFHQVAPYYYGPGFHEPGAMLALGVNRGVWDGLTPEEQRIIRVACAHANEASLAEYTHQNALALQTLIEEHGVQLRAFPEDVWARVAALSEQVLAAQAEADDLTRRIYESFIAARARGMAWARVGDEPYLRARSQHLSPP